MDMRYRTRTVVLPYVNIKYHMICIFISYVIYVKTCTVRLQLHHSLTLVLDVASSNTFLACQLMSTVDTTPATMLM